ncbi:ABC transporter permease [Mycoplasmopsis iners]|uniref:ABC transporter permease n=1 Tax=Mycoplasmopsis iners TaxID=76630 RepID=UPI00068C9816|nr:ABC transporter permease [Mycoplasmopsis iners]
MKNSIRNYLNFLNINIFAKKITWITWLTFLALNLIINITIGIINPQVDKNLIIFIIAFVQILFSIFFSSFIYINIFKELEEEGIEILSLSKPISRKHIYIAKSLYCLIYSVFYALSLMLINLSLILGLRQFNLTLIYLLINLVAFTLIFNFFGVIASLLAYKLNTKFAMTVPFIVSAPLMIGGSIINQQSTSSANNMAYFLNLNYANNLSGNISNSEKFYLNNAQDNYYILPNGFQNRSFSQKQSEMLKEFYKMANNSATELLAYSWTIIPYQFLDIFNVNNKNIFSNNSTNNLNNYLYYPKQDSYLYKYKLAEANLRKFEVINNDEISKQYIVPSALKNQS